MSSLVVESSKELSVGSIPSLCIFMLRLGIHWLIFTLFSLQATRCKVKQQLHRCGVEASAIEKMFVVVVLKCTVCFGEIRRRLGHLTGIDSSVTPISGLQRSWLISA